MSTSEPLNSAATRKAFPGSGLLVAGWNLSLVLVPVVTLASFFGEYSRRAELLCNFRAQYAVMAAVMFLLCLAWRQWRRACLPGAALLANLYVLAPYLWVTPPTVGSEPTHRALLLNLFVDNEEHEQVRQLVRDFQPEFIVFTELTPSWLAALDPLREQYPYCLLPTNEELKTDLHLGLYSKVPLGDGRREQLVGSARPGIVATLDLQPLPLLLLATHPRTPMSDWGLRTRNNELMAYAEVAAVRSNEPVLLLGDLNVSCFSPVFADFTRQSRLRDSQLDFGLQPSWPTFYLPCRIPIDHCLTSPRVILHQRRLGPSVGSDHFPVLVDFSIRPPE